VPCDGADPVPETCNGLDDDCDGLTDEGTCDDGNVCTADSCTGLQCGYKSLFGPCDTDGDACTWQYCAAGSCLVTSKKSCDDGKPCTGDVCDPKTGACSYVPLDGKACEDGNLCTKPDTCVAGDCQPGATLLCDDANPCTMEICTPGTGQCSVKPVSFGVPCSDGNACTSGDTCNGQGSCAAKAVNCDDGNPCTTDGCVAQSGCTHVPANGLPCDDGWACTKGELCQDGACKPKVGVGCNDGDPCTADTCDLAKGCINTKLSGPCDDGNACSVGETCATGFCAGGKAVNCDDANPCTNDGCDGKTGCTHAANPLPCNDGNLCTVGDVCTGGSCVPGKAPNCEDGLACTADTCDKATGGCVHTPDPKLCDDGNVCTLDACLVPGGCKHDKIEKCCGGVECKTDEECIVYPDTVAPFCAKKCNSGVDCPGSCCFMTYKTKHCLTKAFQNMCCGTSETWETEKNPYACGVGGKGSCVNYPNKKPPYYPSNNPHCDMPCKVASDCPGSCCGTTTLGNFLCVAPDYKDKFCPGF
jgi:hypothetical protein